MAALQHNRDLTIQRLDPVKAGTFETIERASFDPELFANFSHTRKKPLIPLEQKMTRSSPKT